MADENGLMILVIVDEGDLSESIFFTFKKQKLPWEIFLALKIYFQIKYHRKEPIMEQT